MFNKILGSILLFTVVSAVAASMIVTPYSDAVVEVSAWVIVFGAAIASVRLLRK